MGPTVYVCLSPCPWFIPPAFFSPWFFSPWLFSSWLLPAKDLLLDFFLSSLEKALVFLPLPLRLALRLPGFFLPRRWGFFRRFRRYLCCRWWCLFFFRSRLLLQRQGEAQFVQQRRRVEVRTPSDDLAIPNLIQLTQRPLDGALGWRYLPCGGSQGASVGASSNELSYRKVLPDVYVGVLSPAVRKSIGPALHELPEPFVTAKGFAGWHGSPFHVLGYHLREDPIVLAVGPQGVDVLSYVGGFPNGHRCLLLWTFPGGCPL